MENASKALIIAGAILLSILIIALGVFIFNQAKSSVGNVGLSDQEISAFNSKWEAYEGTQIGSSARALINQINNYNRTANDGRYIHLVLAASKPTDSSDKEFVSGVNNGAIKPADVGAGTSCTVTIQKTSGGLVSKITISGSGIKANDNEVKQQQQQP